VLEKTCAQLLRRYFREKRQPDKKSPEEQ